MDRKIAHIKKSWLGFDIYISKAYFDGEFIHLVVELCTCFIKILYI
jgi:hypothetical protein